MLNSIKSLFGLGPQINFKDLMEKGAIIIDVRTPGEFHGGHIKGSANIPLDKLQSNIGKLKKGVPIITCCASGMRSSSAKNILLGNGFKEVHNGGGWASLNQKLKS